MRKLDFFGQNLAESPAIAPPLFIKKEGGVSLYAPPPLHAPG